MFETSKDIFYIAISGGFILLVIFLCVLLFNIILITRDVSKITDKTKDIVDQVNKYVLTPVKMLNRIIENINPIIDMVEKKVQDHQKKKKK